MADICECSALDGTDSGLKYTYPKCPFGEWEDRQQPDFKRPNAAASVADLLGVPVEERRGIAP